MNIIKELVGVKSRVEEIPMGSFVKRAGQVYIRLGHSTTRPGVIDVLNIKEGKIEYLDGGSLVHILHAEILLRPFEEEVDLSSEFLVTKGCNKQNDE